jgi:hypothetical protein
MEKERDKVRGGVLQYMIAHNIQSGTVGPYVATRQIRHRGTYIDELIPPETLALAKQQKPYEVLLIRKPKKGTPVESADKEGSEE